MVTWAPLALWSSFLTSRAPCAASFTEPLQQPPCVFLVCTLLAIASCLMDASKPKHLPIDQYFSYKLDHHQKASEPTQFRTTDHLALVTSSFVRLAHTLVTWVAPKRPSKL